MRVDRADHHGRRLGEATLGRGAAVEVQLDPDPHLAGDRHFRQCHGETAVTHVVHARDGTVAHERCHELVDGARPIEIGGRRHPAVETVHDRGPLRTAELRTDLAEHHDVVAGTQARGRRALA